MATENKVKTGNSGKNSKKRKHYLPYNKPVKKGAYPLRPGVEGFFITCEGGRESRACHEAINVIESFYEELVGSSESKFGQAELPKKSVNKVTKFTYSDSSSSDDDDDDEGDSNNAQTDTKEQTEDFSSKDGVSEQNSEQNQVLTVESKNRDADALEPPAKKQHVELEQTEKDEHQSVDKLIEAELAEMGDRSKRRFARLDTGCNGVIFIQMSKKEGDPGPKDIVQHMMTSLASTKKHVSRFLLRLLPVEITCYTSEDEIKRAIKPLIMKYFPDETDTPHKFAVLYDARANTGVERSKVIDAVAKSVPSIHKVDLEKPDIHITVQIVKTLCLIGVVEKYKELAKYNIRQLTSPDQ